jgi:hypothetical protein
MNINAKQKRVVNLKLDIKALEVYRKWCVDGNDPMREENACLALSEARAELRKLRAELRA